MIANPKPGDEPGIPMAFHDPMKDWTNDDLLLDQKEREHFREKHPRLGPIFDWPELRAAFETHEGPANDARRKSRRNGVAAVALGFGGLAFTALTTFLARLFPDPALAERWIGGAAAALIVLGGLVGYQQVLVGQEKQRWLVNRYWTERIRQFHFQLILNNLGKAAEAMNGGKALDDWRKFRQSELVSFLHDTAQNLLSAFDRLGDDRAEETVWVNRAWTKRLTAPAETAELAELLSGLYALRIRVQERYADQKLHSGIFSPRTRAGWLLGLSDALTAAIVLLTVAIGTAYAFDFGYVEGATPKQPKLWFLFLLGLAGALTAAVVAIRVLNEGLLHRTEAERYEWYLASVRSIDRRFESTDAAAGRIELLRELERLAYQEMRRFLLAFQEARFIM